MLTRILTLTAMLVIGLTAQPAQATQELRDKMRELAQRILATTRNQPVAIGTFTGSVDLRDTNSGPGLEGVLTEELNLIQKGVVATDPRLAKFEVKGDYAFAKTRDPKLANIKVVKVKARIIDTETAEDLEQIPFEVILDHTNTIAKVLQFSGSLPDLNADGSQASRAERNQAMDRQRSSPAVTIKGSKVSSSAASPYDVEILARPDLDRPAIPRAPKIDGGHAFVDLDRGEIYEVKVYNRSEFPVAISLSVDGLDMFHFSQDRVTSAAAEAEVAAMKDRRDYDEILKEAQRKVGRPRFTHLILDPSGKNGSDGTTLIPGWHNALEGDKNYLSFLVTAYGQGAVSKEGVKARGQVGVIHLQFSECSPIAPGSRAAGGNETGFGPPRKVSQQAVHYEIKPPHDFVTIRYTRPQQ